jgi:hypothetical protein
MTLPARLLANAPVLALAVLGACRTTARGYFEDRLHDTADILPFSVGSGPGFHVGARATAFLGTGVGYAETSRWGWGHRPADAEDPASLAGSRSWHETEKGFVVYWVRDGDPPPGAGNAGFILPIREDERGMSLHLEPGSALDAEVDVHLGYVGFRIGLSPIQLIDWLLGWFTLDFARDDLNGRLEGETVPAKTPEARRTNPRRARAE